MVREHVHADEQGLVPAGIVHGEALVVEGRSHGARYGATRVLEAFRSLRRA